MDSTENKMEIVTVINPVTIEQFLPVYEYLIQGVRVSDDTQQLKENLYSFLNDNIDLITNGMDTSNIVGMEDFSKGFRNAIALIKLWIDSMYMTNEQTLDFPINEENTNEVEQSQPRE